MDDLLYKLYITSSIATLLPTLLGIIYFGSLNPALKLNWLLGIAGNILMVLSNTQMDIYLKNSSFFYYISLAFNGLFTCLIIYTLHKTKKSKLYCSLFLILFYIYLIADVYYYGIKSNNILPYVLIDLLSIFGMISALNSNLNLNKYMQYFMYTYLIYSLLDVIYSTFTTLFQDFEGNDIFNIFWLGYSSIIQIFFSMGISFVVYLANKSKQPSFGKIKIFQ